MSLPVMLYVTRSTKNAVNKTIAVLGFTSGVFKEGYTDFKTPSLLVKDVSSVIANGQVNYIAIDFRQIGAQDAVYRYYFIDKVGSEENGLFRLDLREDVLMTFANLIREQVGFVTRSANLGSDMIPDRMIQFSNKYEEVLLTFTNGSFKNFSFDTDLDQYDNPANANIVFAVANQGYGGDNWGTITPPASGINLPPSIKGRAFQNQQGITLYAVNSLTPVYYNAITQIMQNEALASYVINIVSYPFFLPHSQTGSDMWLGNTQISPTAGDAKTMTKGISDYLVIADISIDDSSDFYDFEPYTMFEMYLPYSGWIELNPSKVRGHRLIVYYVVNYVTGTAMVCVYDVTAKMPIYSGNCQLGTSVSWSRSNEAQNENSRIGSAMNLALAEIGATVGVAAGVITENPAIAIGAIIGGVSAGAQYVASDLMRFERSQVSMGSGNAGMHMPQDVLLKAKRRLAIDGTYLSLVTQKNIVNMHAGKPFNDFVRLANCSGYTEVGFINFKMGDANDAITAVDGEVNEIIALLKQGVIF